MKRIIVILGTRPEAIKMAPVLHALKKEPAAFSIRLCQTGQHRELVQGVLDFFHLQSDYDLAVMDDCKGDLTCLTAAILTKLQPVLQEFQPHFVIVHGDTTTTFAASLAGFYAGVKVCHLEAGLRTFDKQQPFPEEMNRLLTSRLADFHFAPTESTADNLRREGIETKNIFLTGNTIVDALHQGMKLLENSLPVEAQLIDSQLDAGKKTVLVTVHRRENQGEKLAGICAALRNMAAIGEAQFIFPIHPNPAVQELARKWLSDCPNMLLLNALSYGSFIWLMKKCDLFLTDSGGIQEEATVLKKPVLLMRELTERPEAMASGWVKVIGNEAGRLVVEVLSALKNLENWRERVGEESPFGDGRASERIVAFLKDLPETRQEPHVFINSSKTD